MPRSGWVALVLVSVAVVTATPVLAQPLPPAAPVSPLDPIAPVAPLAPDAQPPLGSTPVRPSQNTERPLPILGAPVGVADSNPQPQPRPQPAPAVAPVGYVDAPVERRPQRAASFGAPSAGDSAFGPAPYSPPVAPVSTAMVDEAVARIAYQPPASDPVNDLLTKRSELREQDPQTSSTKTPKHERSAGKFGEGLADKFDGLFGSNSNGWFRSDHMFDGFISPVTNPFLFEDPRSLTELRPIFIYQKVPTSQPDFHGGNVVFFGTQARVAFTDRWSLVINKFGGVSVNTNEPSPYRDSTGFAEIWLGPKWTFYRGEENGTLAAAGLQLQLPVGSRGAFQDTGSLSLAPYVSYAQSFLRDFRWGSFNFMANTGLAFSTSSQRSDYYWLSAHLDFDVGNNHRFYPLAELNWFLYTANGKANQIGVEGRDLINFGGQPKGSGLMTGAFGARYKISENAQLGGAFEFPFAGRKDLFRYRFTVDFILRY